MNGMQGYSTVPSRNLIRAEMRMLKHAEPIQVLGKFGEQKEQPLNKTDTIVFRRLRPFNAGSNEVAQIEAKNFATAEGVTPTPNTIQYTDVTVTVKQYAVLFKFTSKAQLMYEDDIPADMAKLTGETMAEVAELIAYGELKAGSAVVYTVGSSRAAVNVKLGLKTLRLAKRGLENNRAKEVNSAIASGPNFDTSAVEPSFLVFIHTDAESDVRDIEGFVPVTKYGTAVKPVHPREIGAVERYRFITSPLFTPYLGAGSGTANGCTTTDGNVDVYPAIVMGQDAFAHVSLKGKGYSGVSPTIIPANQKNHANPSGMFGYVGADFWYAPKRTNDNWMQRIEHGISDLIN